MTALTEPPDQRLPPWPDLAPFQPVLEAANIVGLFEWDLEAGRIIPCLGMSRLFRLDRSVVLTGAPAADFLPALHPEDRMPFIERVAGESAPVSRMSYRLTSPTEAQRVVVECTRYACDGQGRRKWACGALFDGPIPSAQGSSCATSAERFEYAALLAMELYRTVRGIEAPTLQTLLDLVLVEIGSGLAGRDRKPSGARLN